MLAKMAKQYRRPLVTFYLGAPPRRNEHGTDFRTFPGSSPTTQDALVQALVRQVVARQGLVRAQLENDDAREVEFIGSKSMADGKHTVLKTLKATISSNPSGHGLDFNALRENVERHNVFVLLQGNLGSHHTNIDTKTFRGFALADRLAPFIVINNNDARPAWSFTLLHEMVHLLLGQTGISGGAAEAGVEQFCNDVASEYLLPQAAIDTFPVSGLDFDHLVESINTLASQRNASRALIAYRLHRSQRINTDLYRRLADYFFSQWNKKQRGKVPSEKGPDYYKVKRHRVGKPLLEFVRHCLGEGELPTTKAAIVLGVKPAQVGAMLEMRAKVG